MSIIPRWANTGECLPASHFYCLEGSSPLWRRLISLLPLRRRPSDILRKQPLLSASKSAIATPSFFPSSLCSPLQGKVYFSMSSAPPRAILHPRYSESTVAPHPLVKYLSVKVGKVFPPTMTRALRHSTVLCPTRQKHRKKDLNPSWVSFFFPRLIFVLKKVSALPHV